MVNELDAQFRKGNLVRILAGPFAGLRGKIESVSDDQRVLRVVLRFFGQSKTVNVFLLDVERLSD
jgi:transcription antitermination factor NusG